MASNLSSVARARASEALARRDEVARLFDLSRDVLLVTESREAIALSCASSSAGSISTTRRSACRDRRDWDVFDAGALHLALDPHELSVAMAGAEAVLEFDAKARTYTGHRTMTVDGHDVRIVPLRLGTRAIGLLAAAAGRPSSRARSTRSPASPRSRSSARSFSRSGRRPSCRGRARRSSRRCSPRWRTTCARR